MIAATADTQPPAGPALSARPPALPCLPLPHRREDTKEINFFSGRQCLGRPGREDERWDLCGARALWGGIALGVTSLLAAAPSLQECFGLGASSASPCPQTSSGSH